MTHTRTEASSLCEKLILEIGANVTWREVKERMSQQGKICSMATFYIHRNKHFPARRGLGLNGHYDEESTVLESKPEPNPLTTPQPPLDKTNLGKVIQHRLDNPDPHTVPNKHWLTNVARFSAVVEDIGGIEKARVMLDMLEMLEAM